MNARTKTLFHFTGKKSGIKDLLRILRDGSFWPHYSLEDVRWLEVPGYPFVAWPMVSFCDIPILRLREHTARYGSYGIGLCREAYTARGLNPILYVSHESHLKDHLRDVMNVMRQHGDRAKQTSGMYLLAYCKPLKGGKEGEGDFYSECEWRFIPWVEGVGGENKFGFFLTEEEYNDAPHRQEANEERRNHTLPFRPDNIRHLVVRSRDEVHQMVCFIDSLPLASHSWADCSKVELDMLKTRIIALDDVSCDL